MKRNYFYVLFWVFFCLISGSCKIGLGEAIDTESPKINITSPYEGAVIRDKFAIKGTYSDDGKIKSIKLDLNNLVTGQSSTYNAEFTKDSYSFTVDPLKDGIKDGNYLANITITDTYGHSTQVSSPYTIDNTAPVIILSRPESKKGSDSFDMFGQEFKIEGRAHDDNEIEIEVQIFDKGQAEDSTESEVLLLTKTLNNVNRSIELTVLDAKNELAEYEKVYGEISTDKNETKNLYCKIIAKDSSKRFPVSETEILPTDNVGNVIETYYLESEFEEVIQASYSATDLYKLLNGTFETSERQADESIKIEDIQKLLNENKISRGQFSLNPANNPNFEVTNFNSPLKKDGKDFDGEDYKLTRGSSITVKVNSGLDGTYIQGKSLGVYVIECDKSGKILENANKIWLIKPEMELVIGEDGLTSTKNIEITEDELALRKAALETQIGVEKSKSYTFKSIELKASKTGMMLGKNYLIFVEGFDSNKTKVSNFTKDYGFYFAPKDAAPSLTLEQPSENTTYLAKGKSLKVKGSSTTEMGSPIIEIRVRDKNDEKVVKTLEKELVVKENDDLSNTSTFEYEIPATDFKQDESDEYVVSVVAKMADKETVKEKTISYDVGKPEILIQSVTPVVQKNEKNNLNKIINIKGSVTDSFTGVQTEKLKYSVLQNGEEKLSGGITTPSNFTITIDTASLTDKKDVVIKFYAEDKAGNKEERSETYFVDQSTDIPEIGSNDKSWDAQIDTEQKLQESIVAGNKNNIFTSGGSIVFNIVDDDGISVVTVNDKDYELNGSPLETSVSYVLPTSSGRNKLDVTVKDIFGVEKKLTVWVQVTGAAPKVTLRASPEYFSRNTNKVPGTPDKITISGVNEGADPFKIEVLGEKTDYSSDVITGSDDKNVNWTHSFVPKSKDINKIKYKVSDYWGIFTETEISFKEDSERPVVEMPDSNMPTVAATEASSFKFKGTSSDVGSVVEKVQVSFDGINWQDAVGTNEWSYTSIFAEEKGFETEGEKTIHVRNFDTAGNYSVALSKTFVFDKAVPQLIVSSPTQSNLITTANITFSGKAWDSYGLKETNSVEIVAKKDGAVVKTYNPTVTLATSEPETTNWSQTISDLADGKYTIEVKATDKTGKVSVVSKKEVTIDSKKPTATITKVPNIEETEKENFKFSGTANDEGTGIKNIQISFDGTNWKEAVGTTDWSYSCIFADDEAFATEGAKTLYVRAFDEAGNISEIEEVKFTFDKSNPTLEIKKFNDTEITSTNIDIQEAFALSGNVSDGYGIKSLTLKQTHTKDGSSVEKTKDVTITEGTWKVENLPWREEGTDLVTGEYKYELVATDNAEKTTKATLTAKIDKEAPAIEIIIPDSSYKGIMAINKEEFTFAGTTTEGEGESGVASYSYIILPEGTELGENPEWTTVDSTTTNWSFKKTIGKDKELAEGSWTIYVKATDKAGNETPKENYSSVNFDIDKAAPIVKEVALSPSSQTSTYSANFSINGKIYDTNGIATVKITILNSKDNKEVTNWIVENINATEEPTENNFVQEISVGDDGKIKQDGNYNIQISVTDKVGKETVETQNVTVDRDAPTVQIAPYGTLNGHENLINSLTFINGTASDAGSGIKTDSGKYVVKQGTTEIASGTLSIQANGDWSAKIENDLLSGKADGEYTIEVTVSDLVDNDAHTAKETLDVIYDKAAPQLEMSNASSITSGSDITLSGKVWDSYGLKESESVEIVVKKASGTQVTTYNPSVIKATTKPDTDNWNQNIVVGSAGLSDGNYTIEIKAIDKVGKSSIEKTISVVIDTEAPTIDISNPDTTYVGTSAISGESFVFTGSVTDAISGPASYSYLLKAKNVAPTENDVWINSPTGTNWSFTKAIGNEDNKIKEGEYTLYVKAMDKAGNESTVVSRNFDVDKSAPVIKEIALSPSSTNNIYKEAFNVKGKIYDTYGIEEVKVSVLNPNLTTSDANYVVSTPWSKNKTDLPTDIQNATSATLDTDNLNVPITIGSGNNIPTDGTYTIEVSVKDKMGKVTTSTKSVTIDTSEPTVTITNPAAEENGATVINGLTKIEGTSSDTGSGIDRANGSYVIKQNGESVTTGRLTIAATGNWSVTIPNNTLPTEGKYTIEVTVKDIVGNTSKSSVNVEYDKEAPHVIASVDKTITKENITVSGKAWDSYGLDTIASVVVKVVSASDLTNVARTYTKVISATTATEPTNNNLTQVIDVLASGTEDMSELPDGNYKVQIIAKDKVGKESIQTIDITVDKAAPTINAVVVDKEKIGTNKHTYMDGETEIVVYNNKQIPIKVSANDNAKGSGIKSVSYSTDKTDDKNYTELVFDKGTNTGKASVTCDWQGLEGAIYIKVEDNAGNVSYSELNTVRIDTIAPEKPTSDITGTKLVNGKNDITVTISAADNGNNEGTEPYNSGIAKVEIVKVGSNTITGISATTGTNNVYSLTLTIPKDKDNKPSGGGVVVKVTDKAGNTTEDTIFTVTVDSENPTVKIAGLIDADPNTEKTTQINGIITLTGTASDNYGIPTMSETEKPVEVSYKVDYADPETTDDTEFTKILGVGGTSTSWSLKINTATAFKRAGRPDPTKDDKITLKVEVTDTAKNLGSDEIEVYVDQDTDRPIINLSNLNIYGMTSSTSVWHKQKYLYGSVTDDDGTIKQFFVSTDGTNWKDEDKDKNKFFRNGSWQYVINDDGEKTLYFKVVDAAGTEFISNATTGAKPKLYDGTNSITTDTNLYLKVDTTQPTIPNVWFRTTNPAPNATTKAEIESVIETQLQNPTGNDWEDSLPTIIGGPDSKLYVMYKAFDANGIHKTKVKCGTNEETETSEKYNVSTLTNQVRVVEFDISNLEDDENNKLVITAYDKATGDEEVGSYSRTFDLNVDNTKPEVSFGSLQNIYYGSESNSISGTMRDTNTISKLYLGLSKNDTEKPSEYLSVDYENRGQNTWTVTFDGGVTTSESTSLHTEVLNKWLDSLYGEGTQNDDAVKDVWLWAYAVDEMGNSSESKVEPKLIKVSPQGDKPSVTIEVPAEGDSTGGSVRISGVADIQTSNIDSVWVQIDPSYDTSTGFDNNWKSELEPIITGVPYSIKENPQYEDESGNKKSISGINGNAAIKANGTSSWNLTINGSKEFQKEGENKTIAVRVYAVSKTGKVSEEAEVSFTIDPKSPRIGNTTPLQLVQYEADGTIKASMNYESGMWIKGKWFLIGSVEDESGISQIKYGDNKGEPVSIMGTDKVNEGDYRKGEVIKVTDVAAAASGAKNYMLKIPVGNDTENDFGRLEYYLNVVEGGTDGKDASQTIILNYDNQAPQFTAELDKIGNEIYQSDGTYSIKGTFDEKSSGVNNQSGFNRIVMFFERSYTKNDVTTKYLVDPMLEGGDSGTANRYPISEFVNKNNLYWRSSTADITDKGILLDSLPTNVRVGGLCMIKDVIYRIQTVREDVAITRKDDATGEDVTTIEDVITIDKPIVNQNDVTVYFALAQVIDNTTVESGLTKAYEAGSEDKEDDDHINGDGDQMIEGVQSTGGTEHKWSVGIDSSLIYDGPITIRFVAFDAAGNMTCDDFSGNVSNNAPRIAGVSFGTDNNGDGTISDGTDKNNDKIISANEINEMITAYSGWYNIESSNKQTGVTQNGKKANGQNVSVFNVGYREPVENEKEGKWETALVVKGNVMVKPEIVGGNTGLGYSVMQGNTTVKEYAHYEGVGHSADGEVRDNDLTIELTVADFLSAYEENTDEVDGVKNFTFSIWDKTEGTTPGVNSQHADINIQMEVMLMDSEEPTVTIDPFYWESKDKNSLYENSRENGHIELEGDLPDTFISNNKNDSIMDRDPKVSGKITIEGTANDNVLLMELGVNTSKDFGTTKTFVSTGYTAIAKRENGTWNSQGTLETNGWQFEAVEETNTQTKGNTLKWKLHLDTEKVSGTAVADFKLQVQAIDRGSAKLVDGVVKYAYESNSNGNKSPDKDANEKEFTQTTSGNPTCRYQMDIVPYITGVQTNLSIKKPTNPSIYNRTALGHYPVKDDEKVVIWGYNLVGAKYDVTKTDVLSSVLPSTIDVLDPNIVDMLNKYGHDRNRQFVVLDVSDISKSGEIDLSVNTIKTLNNKNNPEACGGSKTIMTDSDYAEYAYNRQPNGYNNDKLDDNVILDIWEFNDVIEAKSGGSCVEPVMRINPIDDRIGFAYANGPAHFSMSNGTSTSYSIWQKNYAKYIGTGFVYDENGNSHGITIGLDTNPDNSDGVSHAGRMTYVTSLWGPGSATEKNGNYNGTRAIRLEAIGVPATDNAMGIGETIMEDRFPSLSLATTMHNDIPTIYYAYYDDLHQAIRFRYGTLQTVSKIEIDSLDGSNKLKMKDNNSSIQNANIYLMDQNNSIIGSASTGQIKNEGNYLNRTYFYELTDVVLNTGKTVNDVKKVGKISGDILTSKDNFDQFVDQVDYNGNSKHGSNVVFDASPNYYSVVVSNDTSVKPGYYVDIDVLKGDSIADDVVVLTWYDATNDALMYSYKKNPCNDNDGYSDSGDDGYWSTPILIMKEAGEYCKIKVDAEGGVHIAAYNISGGDLIYAHLNNYTDTICTDVARVDTCDDTGENITLDIAKSSKGNWIPYIGYYMGSAKKNKIAYLIEESGSISYTNGSESEKFTQKWEVSIIPTTSTVKKDHVNVGVWKDNTGSLKETINSTTNTGNEDEGDCWGNGTTNPVLGYAIRVGTVGHIETAQMK